MCVPSNQSVSLKRVRWALLPLLILFKLVFRIARSCNIFYRLLSLSDRILYRTTVLSGSACVCVSIAHKCVSCHFIAFVAIYSWICNAIHHIEDHELRWLWFCASVYCCLSAVQQSCFFNPAIEHNSKLVSVTVSQPCVSLAVDSCCCCVWARALLLWFIFPSFRVFIDFLFFSRFSIWSEQTCGMGGNATTGSCLLCGGHVSQLYPWKRKDKMNMRRTRRTRRVHEFVWHFSRFNNNSPWAEWMGKTFECDAAVRLHH